MNDKDQEIIPGVWPGDFVMRKGDGKFYGGKVKAVYVAAGIVYIDLWLYNAEGMRLPRQSPSEGGPTSFEPALELSDFIRIEGKFPIDESIQWVPNERGGRTARRAPELSVTTLPWRARKRATRARTVRTAPTTPTNSPSVEGASKRLAAEHIRSVMKMLVGEPEAKDALRQQAERLETEAARDDQPMK